MEKDRDIPIILGCPFLATRKALVNVQKGELNMRMQDKKVTFNVFKAIKYPNNNNINDWFSIDVIHFRIVDIKHILDILKIEKNLCFLILLI